jgi:hypothetical protein
LVIAYGPLPAVGEDDASNATGGQRWMLSTASPGVSSAAPGAVRLVRITSSRCTGGDSCGRTKAW